MAAFKYLFACTIALGASVHAAPGPVKERSYLLFNQEPGTNPYQYLAWTPDSSVVSWAENGVPGLFMARTKADVVPPRSLWMFDPQDDGTHRIYNVDNTYGGQPKRLDVRSEGSDPFLWDINAGSVGQVWQLYSQPDGISLQIWNPAWKKALDIDIYGDKTLSKNKYGIWMNGVTGDNLAGQRWQLADWTPTITLTATQWVTSFSSVIPAPTIEYVGGQVVTETSTSTVDVTETVQETSIIQVTLSKRDAFKIPTPTTITSTIGTTTLTTTSTTTLSQSTSSVVTGGGTNTKVVFETRTITTTATVSVSQINSVQTLSVNDAKASSVGGAATILSQSATDGVATVSSFSTTGTVGAAGAATSSPDNSQPAPANGGGKSNTPMIAGLAAGMGVLFLLLLAVVIFFLRRRKKKNDAEGSAPVYAPVQPSEPGKELPGDSRVVSGVGSEAAWQPVPMGGNEKALHHRSAELDGGGFHATMSGPGDYDSPYELPGGTTR